jgi:hypothetical protein
MSSKESNHNNNYYDYCYHHNYVDVDRYEDLVKQPEQTLQKIFDYLQIPFDEKALKFYENNRAVHTHSQTRKLISV